MFAVAQPAKAYPNFISYGYGSCLTCHYNPHGNGPLTDYGRALSATEVSDRFFSGKKTTEEQITDRSGFLFSPPSQTIVRPSMDYRGLYLKRNYRDEAEKDYFITMDLNATVVAKFLKRDKLTLVGQIGYAPKPLALAGQNDIETYRSREHYVGYRVAKEFGIYVGLMDKVFGIRLPDHIAFSRTATSLVQNDQTHGVVFHYSGPAVELGIHPFVGNLVQSADLRQKGISGMLEVPVGTFARVGASGLGSASEYLFTAAGALHARIGIGQGNSVLIESGQVEKQVEASKKTTKSRYLTTQSHLHLRRGLWALLTAEALQADLASDGMRYRVGPGIQFFPLQRLELRGDIYRNVIQAGQAESASTDVTAQIHVWL